MTRVSLGLLPTEALKQFISVVMKGASLLLLTALAAGQTATFGPAQPALLGLANVDPNSAVFGDFNRDGKLDLAVLNVQNSSIVILLGKGDGTFDTGITVPLKDRPFSLAIGDANNDGNPDLFVLSNSASTLSILLGGSDGTFQNALSTPTARQFPAHLAVGDFNRDGQMDLAISTGQQTNGVAQILVSLGKGDGTFAASGSYPAGGAPSRIEAGDLNGDGRLDLVVEDRSSNTVSVLLGAAGGQFTPLLPLISPPIPIPGEGSLVLADLNGDKHLDLIAGNQGSQILTIALGKGDGTFTLAPAVTVITNGSSIAVGDFNSDGKPDLVVVYNVPGLPTFSLFASEGDGTFQAQVLQGFGQPSFVLAADVDGDGRIDLVTTQPFPSAVAVFRNTTSPTTPNPPVISLSNSHLQFSLSPVFVPPAPQVVAIANSGAGVLAWSAVSNVPWLTILTVPPPIPPPGSPAPSPQFASGTAPSTISVLANANGLSPGMYNGAISVTSTGAANSPQSISVTLTVLPAPNSPVISLSSSQLQFTLTPSGLPPPQQVIQITNSGPGPLPWAADSSATWLSIYSGPLPPVPPPPQAHAAGTSPSLLTVVANPIGLSPGVYTGVISVASAGATNSPQTILVTLTMPGAAPQGPMPSLRSIQNSASYAYKVAQGSIFVVTGFSLGPAQLAQASAGSLPTQLSGTSVQVVIGGAIIDCPIAYTSAAQIAAVLPSQTPLGSGTFTVTYGGQTSYPGQIRVVSSGVGIYTVASSGIGTGIITGLDYVTKTFSQPAKPGDIVIAWATGLGPISGNDALVSPSALFSNVEVFVGDQAAKVIGAGRSGCCAGLDQIAFQVPAAPLGCFVPVSIRVGGGAVAAGGSYSNFVTLPLSQSGEPCSSSAPGLPSALVSKAASGQQLSIGVLAIGPGPVLRDVAPSLQMASLAASRALAVQLSQSLHVAVPEADVSHLLTAYQSDNQAAVRKILARYARALKNNPSARKLLRSAADLAQQQSAVAAFGQVSAIGLIGPEYASDFPPTGTCTIVQSTPSDPSARIAGMDAGSVLSINGPAGRKAMPQVAPGQYSVVLGTGPSSANTAPGFYTVSGTGGTNIGPFSISLNVSSPLTWTNKSAVNLIDRTRPLTVTWSGSANPGHVVIGGTAKASNAASVLPDTAGALFVCTEDAQRGTFTVPQFILSALSGGQNVTLFIAPYPLDHPVSIPGLDLAFLADGSSDSKIIPIQ